MKTDEKRIRCILDLARRCVLRGQAPQAIAHLDSVRLEIDDFAGTSVRAEYELIYAGVLAAMRDPGAEYAFDDAFQRISELSEPDPALKMRAHGEFGKYLAEQLSFRRAREQYRLAEKIAESLDDSDEDLAHFQMCLIGIELQEMGDSQLRAFQSLKRAATIDGGANAVDQREAWFHYVDEFRSGTRQMLAARKGNEPTVDYFCGVLSQIRRRRSEPVK
jgi:hypothetical protein